MRVLIEEESPWGDGERYRCPLRVGAMVHQGWLRRVRDRGTGRGRGRGRGWGRSRGTITGRGRLRGRVRV